MSNPATEQQRLMEEAAIFVEKFASAGFDPDRYLELRANKGEAEMPMQDETEEEG